NPPPRTDTYPLSLHDALPIFHQPPSRLVGDQRRVTLVAVVHLVHLFDGVEVADDVGRAEGLAGLDRLAVDLLDHDDDPPGTLARSEEHTSELQSRVDLVCRLL